MNARLCPTEIIRIECWTGRRSMHPKPRRAPRLHWMMTTQAIPVLGKSPDIWWVNALFVLIYYIIYILYLVMDEFCSLLSLVCSWLSLQGTSPRFGDGYCGASLHVKVRSPSITEDWTCSFYTIGSVRGKDIPLPRSAVAQLDADTDSTMHGLRHTYLSPVLAELALVVLVGKGNVALLQPGTIFLVWDHHFAASSQHHWNMTCLIFLRICSSNTLHTHAEYSLNNCHDHRDVLAVLYWSYSLCWIDIIPVLLQSAK